MSAQHRAASRHHVRARAAALCTLLRAARGVTAKGGSEGRREKDGEGGWGPRGAAEKREGWERKSERSIERKRIEVLRECDYHHQFYFEQAVIEYNRWFGSNRRRWRLGLDTFF